MAEQYLLDIKEKDEMSQLLAETAATTLHCNSHIETIQQGKNRIIISRIPQDSVAIVFSVGGDIKELRTREYAESAIKRLLHAGKNISADLIGFADVIDARRTNRGLVEVIGETLAREARKRGLGILNGELANLGIRVVSEYNLSLTGLGFIPKASKFAKEIPGTFTHDKINYAVFDPKLLPIFINSDGIRTKTELYERTGEFKLGVNDFFAMNLDDCVKLGTVPQVISGVVETKGAIPFKKINKHAVKLGKTLEILSILQHEPMENRILGYDFFAPSYNISGSVVSTIDEETLRALPMPHAGDYLIAIRGKPNPRSNGITVKRELMERLFGKDWHKTREGKVFIKYLAQPSTIFYPVFKDLFDKDLASSVYHMSGGAYNGKLARPLAKHNLFVKIGKDDTCAIEDLFEPDWREILMSAYTLSVRDAYAIWPMGNEAFVTSNYPIRAKDIIRHKFGLEARTVGRLETAVNGHAGVMLRTYNGQEVYFNGLAA